MTSYCYKKRLQAICFSRNPMQYFDEDILTPEFIEELKLFLKGCNKVSLINNQMKDNLIELAAYFRHNGYFSLANEFILLINGSDINRFLWLNLLYQEHEERKFNKNDIFNINSLEQLEKLFYSLEMDYVVLQALLCEYEEFEEKYLKKFTLNPHFFASCKKIFQEKPEIFEDIDEVTKVWVVHLLNEKMRNNISIENWSEYKETIKAGKILTKKVIK